LGRGFGHPATQWRGRRRVFPHERYMNRPISLGSVAVGQDVRQSAGSAPQSGGLGFRQIEDENEPMALALTILAIALASLALGVQLADLRSGRGRPALNPTAPNGSVNDNDPTAVREGITLVRPKIVPASVTRRSAHR
jgi:hypothetical protein